jgi:hypothetical protein
VKKLAIFPKTNVIIKCLHKVAAVREKNNTQFRHFFQKILIKITSSVPGAIFLRKYY